MSTIDAIRQLIESRLADLDEERERLERAIVSLSGGGARGQKRARSSARSAPSSTPTAKLRPSRSGVKRAARGQRRAELLAAMKANPGARPSQLANTLGIKPAQVHALLAKARAESLVVKDGRGYAVNTKAALSRRSRSASRR